jgi:hypothetical protein
MKKDIKTDLKYYVTEFNAIAKKTVESTLDISRIALDAHDNLTDENYTIFKERVRYCDSSLRKLEKIAKKYDVFCQYKEMLPANFTTLYVLSKLSDEKIVELAASNQLHSRLTNDEAENLVKKEKADSTNNLESDEADSTTNEVSVKFLSTPSLATATDIQTFFKSLRATASCMIDSSYIDSVVSSYQSDDVSTQIAQ